MGQGRYKLISSPEKMWELFVAYKESAKNKPILVQDFVGKDGQEVRRERERPLTMEGFECFVMDSTDINYPDLCHYFSGTNESYKDFFAVCSRIKREIRQDQISGGMAGIYNPSITQRLNGLTDKQENHNNNTYRIIDDTGAISKITGTTSGTTENP
jgi:hypothetical protein